MIKVPEGMLKAAVEAWRGNRVYENFPKLEFFGEERIPFILEAALEWLSENPIEPTKDEWFALCRDTPVRTDRERLGEWQRRMFFVPEYEIRPHVRRMLQGCTLTHAEADYVVNELRMVSNGWTPNLAYERGRKAK